MNEDRKWLVIKIGLALSVIGVIIYGIYVNNQNKIDITKYNKDDIVAANQDNGEFDDAVLGNRNAKVKVIEYGDYQCPACGRYHKTFEKLVEKYPNQVALVFRHYILPDHTDARLASGVALAAARQGKFWQMHEKIFKNQSEWTGQGDKRESIFEKYAQELGLDLAKYKADLKSKSISQKIDFDMELGRAHKLNATPTIIINSEAIDPNTWSDEAKLHTLIENKLKAKA